MLQGLEREDLFTVVHDQFLTDTARYADIVLPATTMLEHPDLVGSWGFSYLSWNEAAIDPIGESKSNAEVTRLLAARLGFDEEVFALSDHELMELALADSPAAASGLRADGLRADGFSRVGPPTGTAVASDATFAFQPCARRRRTSPDRQCRPRLRIRSYPVDARARAIADQRPYGTQVVLNAEPPTGEVPSDDAPLRNHMMKIESGDSVASAAVVTDNVGRPSIPFDRWERTRCQEEPTR